MVFKLFFFFVVVFFLESCLTNCGYQLTNQPNEHRCGCFDLSCKNQSQTIISFPASGDFSLEYLSYDEEAIGLRDPDGCLPKRLLKGFDPSGTPFDQIYLLNFTLLNCSADVPIFLSEVTYVSCLSSENNTTVAIPVDRADLITTYYSSCLKIGMVSLSVPEGRKNWKYLGDEMWLTWKEPDCKMLFKKSGNLLFQEK